jgi:cation diffusion facilitator CzcD-associated flavoprotein CzcO
MVETEWNKNVETATFDEDQKKWLVECSDGMTRLLLLYLG